MAIISDIRQLDFSRSYTYADYLTWQFRERVELIMGKIFKMSPAPSSQHQHIVSVLTAAFFQFLKGTPCTVFPAPFDVVLPIGSNEDTVVQPDLTVVCDRSKITTQGCIGSPDLVVEVVSKSSVRHDLHEKFQVYEQAGVREYWIIHPTDKSLIIFVLNQAGKYEPSKPLTRGDIAFSATLQGFQIDLNELFTDVVAEPEVDYESAVNRI
ncbi:MAG: Uma2 family endonuclease [Cyclobacteriaceae bacterium]|nr:Uma2 family endonuclease [Cyclobacteriaceae bacterium]